MGSCGKVILGKGRKLAIERLSSLPQAHPPLPKIFVWRGEKL